MEATFVAAALRKSMRPGRLVMPVLSTDRLTVTVTATHGSGFEGTLSASLHAASTTRSSVCPRVLPGRASFRTA
jgi:hypothetical protein